MRVRPPAVRSVRVVAVEAFRDMTWILPALEESAMFRTCAGRDSRKPSSHLHRAAKKGIDLMLEVLTVLALAGAGPATAADTTGSTPTDSTNAATPADSVTSAPTTAFNVTSDSFAAD